MLRSMVFAIKYNAHVTSELFHQNKFVGFYRISWI